MTYEQWIEHCEKVILQYKEGAIFSAEAFNAIIAKASEVEQKDICFASGLEVGECNCDSCQSDPLMI